MFYDNYVELCVEKGISPSRAAVEIGLNKASVTNWKKNGYTPRADILQRIADYFGVPLDFFLGRPPFENWERINQDRRAFLQATDIEPELLALTWGFDIENPEIIPTKEFIAFLSEAVEDAYPTEAGSWTVNLRSLYKKEKAPTLMGERTFKNVLDMPKTYSVPLIGAIACGQPILAVEDADETVLVPNWVHADFALRCKGDSMINARIFDGDIVYIHKQPSVDNGQIAAVRVGDEATLKKVYYNGQRLILRAANPLFPDLEYEGFELEDIEVLGKAVAFTSMLSQD